MAVQGPLAPYRVLDLSSGSGLLCGKLLADLGADAIVVEPPGGHPARLKGPFVHGVMNPESSLYWLSRNTSKRSITLDIRSHQGQELLRRLVPTAHFLIESFPPGYLQSLGISYGELSTINPGLIMVSISPFGHSGPFKDFEATDLTVQAMSGLMFVTGDGDRPPVKVWGDQSDVFASLYACAAILTAHFGRKRTGVGQWIDVSMQEAMQSTVAHIAQGFEVSGTVHHRLGIPFDQGPRRGFGPAKPNVFPCKDGYIMVSSRQLSVRVLANWLRTEGLLTGPSGLESSDKSLEEMRSSDEQQMRDLIESALSRLFVVKTRHELFEKGVELGLPMFPLNSPRDVLEWGQFRSRGFFHPISYPEHSGTILSPGWPCWAGGAGSQNMRRPPRVGEHNEEVYRIELGVSEAGLERLKRDNVL